MEMNDSLEYKLGRIEGKLDMLLKSRDEDTAANTAYRVALEARINILERWKWMLMGGAIVASTLVSVTLRWLK